MSQTLTEKVLGRGLTGRTLDGSEWREVEPDLLLGHDATIALVVDRFADADKPLAFPERLFLVADHFAPPSTVDRANVLRRFLDFVERHGIGGPAGGTFQMMQGICHQVLVESPRCVPGSIVVGADSHTTMAGALGAFATGMGSTDILAVLQTGTTWLRIPPSDRIVLEGSMAPHLRGKDLALWMMRTYGEGGAGCFSDGKLTCRITGPDVDWVLERFVECGGRESLVYENRPHLGSNKLPMICRNFRRKIESLGGEYRFGCKKA